VTEFGPMYQHGSVYTENLDLIQRLDLTDCEFGIQVGWDGRVWVCINGIAWIRFKPSLGQRYGNIAMGERTLTPEDEDLISNTMKEQT
jgi:hypothetical protein